MSSLEEMALRLFNHEHPDIWIKRVEVVLGVSE